jgi:hypothetical protein
MKPMRRARQPPAALRGEPSDEAIVAADRKLSHF